MGAREVWAGRLVSWHCIATPDRVFAHDGGAGLSGSSNFVPAVQRGWALYPPAPPKSKPSDAILVSSLSTPDERLNYALELSAALEASQADIAAWKDFLGPQPESLAAQADRIMTQARTVRDVAEESLRAFLAQHGISQLQLEERHATWLASKRAAQALATTAPVLGSLDVARGTHLLEIMKENWRFIAAHAPDLIAPRVLKRAPCACRCPTGCGSEDATEAPPPVRHQDQVGKVEGEAGRCGKGCRRKQSAQLS